MEINILNRQSTVLNKFIAEIRDRRIQCDSYAFPPQCWNASAN